MAGQSRTPGKPRASVPSPFDPKEPSAVDPETSNPISNPPTPDGSTAEQPADAPAAGPADQATPTEKPKRKYEKKVLKTVPVDELGDSEDVPEDEWEQHPLTASVAERDPAQIVLDTEFKSLLDTWVAAGKPDYRHSPRKRRVTSPEHAPAIRKMYSEAAKLYDVGVKFAPASHDQHGREVIVYAPEKKIVRPRRGKDVTAPPANDTAPPVSTPPAGDGALPGEPEKAPAA